VNEHTWEPFKDLSNAMEKVHKFHQRYPNKPNPLDLMELVVKQGGDVTNANMMFNHDL
jgi:hypothetical protein